MRYTFPKAEHLCLKNDIDGLFNSGKAFIAFPYRIVFRKVERNAVPVKVMVISQKKKFRKAVDRVHIRRQMREAYRLNKHILFDFLEDKTYSLHIAFNLIDDKISPQSFMQSKMTDALSKLVKKLEE